MWISIHTFMILQELSHFALKDFRRTCDSEWQSVEIVSIKLGYECRKFGALTV